MKKLTQVELEVENLVVEHLMVGQFHTYGTVLLSVHSLASSSMVQQVVHNQCTSFADQVVSYNHKCIDKLFWVALDVLCHITWRQLLLRDEPILHS